MTRLTWGLTSSGGGVAQSDQMFESTFNEFAAHHAVHEVSSA